MNDRQDQKPVPITYLSEDDAAVLDALIDARARGIDIGPMPVAAQPRYAKLRQVLGLLNELPVEEPADDLKAKTLDRIREHQQKQRFSQQVAMLSEEKPFLQRFAWKQVLSGAAIFLIGLSLLIPSLNRARHDAGQIACAGQLARAGQAIGQYAMDHNQTLPRNHKLDRDLWWDISDHSPAMPAGMVRSNFPHLQVLIAKGYTDSRTLICPEQGKYTDAKGQVHQGPVDPWIHSYDYQNQYATGPIRADRNNNLAILADKNPLFIVRATSVPGGSYAPQAAGVPGGVVLISFDPSSSPSAASRAHASDGQNVLTAEGVVTWTIQPVIDRPELIEGDNIWVLDRPQPRDQQSRDTYHDSFLVP